MPSTLYVYNLYGIALPHLKTSKGQSSLHSSKYSQGLQLNKFPTASSSRKYICIGCRQIYCNINTSLQIIITFVLLILRVFSLDQTRLPYGDVSRGPPGFQHISFPANHISEPLVCFIVSGLLCIIIRRELHHFSLGNLHTLSRIYTKNRARALKREDVRHAVTASPRPRDYALSIGRATRNSFLIGGTCTEYQPFVDNIRIRKKPPFPQY